MRRAFGAILMAATVATCSGARAAPAAAAPVQLLFLA